MKKRLLSLLLVLLMVFGMLPNMAMAEEAEAYVYKAAYSNAVTVDGTLSEPDWRTYGKLSDGTSFGALWDSGHLYLAAADDVTVTVNGTAVTPAAYQKDSAVELSVALAGLITLTSYTQSVDLKLETDSGSWEGKLEFTSLQRAGTANYDNYGQSVEIWSGSTTVRSVGYEPVSGGVRLYNHYVDPVDANDNAAGGRAYAFDTVSAPWRTMDKTMTLEADILVADMPEYTLAAHEYTHVFPMYGLGFTVSNNDNKGITTGVTNTADGLQFVVYGKSGGLRSAAIGKGLNEAFHLRQDVAQDGSLTVYVDDQFIATFPNAFRNDDKGLDSIVVANYVNINLWGDAAQVLTADGAQDADVTVTNLTFGKLAGETALDTLDFDDIRGQNTDANTVRSDLNLMTSWSDGMLQNVPLTWTSSHPDLIDPDTGKVTPGSSYVDVTLTASIPDTTDSKTFVVTVAPMFINSYFTNTAITMDGAAICS